MDKRRNLLQEEQDGVKCEIVVNGVANWEECLPEKIKLNEPWASMCGGEEVPLLVYLHKIAEANAESFERAVVIDFLNRGYRLEELEADIANGKDWGKCVWYKDHPGYAEPIPGFFKGSAVNDPSFYHAMFRTENAGDQHHGLYSTQMLTGTDILPHKTLVYRRVVFSPPLPKEQKVAA